MNQRAILLAVAAMFLPACSGGGHAAVVAGQFLAAMIQVDQGPAFGAARNPAFCCENGVLYVAWSDDRNAPGGGNDDAYFNRSLDGGDTWLAADIRVNTNVAGASDTDVRGICCSGSSIYVAFTDDENGSEDVYVNYSTDGGVTWQPNAIRLDPASGGGTDSNAVGICCDGPNVYVIWSEDLPGGDQIFLNASSDGGQTWFASEVWVDSGVSARAEGPALCCDGLTVYAAWRGENPGSVIYANVSSDGGQTWPNAEAVLNPGGVAVDPPRMTCDGDSVFVVWNSDAEEDIYFNSSLDGGDTWQAAEQRLNTNAVADSTSDNPVVCGNGPNVYVAWVDQRLGSNQIFFNRSVDGGLSWEANDIRIETDPAESNNCAICCEGNSVYIAWTDKRLDPIEDVFFNYSHDAGLTWQARDMRVDTDAPGVSDPNRPRICCDAGMVYVLWHLDNPTGHIYLNRGAP